MNNVEPRVGRRVYLQLRSNCSPALESGGLSPGLTPWGDLHFDSWPA
jgi:hypothetical protein